MAIERLSPTCVRTLTRPGSYHDGGGLYLRVRGPDQRAWAYRFMLRGRARWMGLGAYPEDSLAEARGAAAAAQKLVRSGADPIRGPAGRGGAGRRPGGGTGHDLRSGGGTLHRRP